MKRAVLFINGEPPQKYSELLQYDKIFCTDGAYHYLTDAGIKPHTVCGDFDSVNITDIGQGIEIIEKTDQNFTDFEKTLQLIVERGFTQVDIFGSSGKEHDHFLGNLNSAVKFKDQIRLTFFDDYSFYFFAEQSTKLNDYKDKLLSLVPFPFATGVTTTGVLYLLNREDLDITGRIGTRNKVTESEVTIEFESGNLLVFIGH